MDLRVSSYHSFLFCKIQVNILVCFFSFHSMVIGAPFEEGIGSPRLPGRQGVIIDKRVSSTLKSNEVDQRVRSDLEVVH